VRTDTTRGSTTAVKFALRGVAASLCFFGLLRLGWIETHLVLPFTKLQGALAVSLAGAPTSAVETTVACSGTDALALCLAAILAYPVRWRMRIGGAAIGAALIIGLNTLRIGTLGRVAGSPAAFDLLHVYVWPALLTLAIASYVFAWMRVADHRHATASRTRSKVSESSLMANPSSVRATRRFVVLALGFLLAFVAASPLYLESARVLQAAGFVAHAAAITLRAGGIAAYAAANVLWTRRGGFAVTQECLATPLIPIYLAAVVGYSTTRLRLVLGVLATVPLFIALGILRLLVVALPDLVASPLFFVHAFYQLLLAAILVFAAALWRHGRRIGIRRALTGVVAGICAAALLGPFVLRAVAFPTGAPLDDPQGAIAFLPSFQVGLYLALWVAAFAAFGWRRFLAGLLVLELTQALGLGALHAFAGHGGWTMHVRDVRGWAIAGPFLAIAAVVSIGRPRR
jgi:exosortase/archaeosortase family protein